MAPGKGSGTQNWLIPCLCDCPSSAKLSQSWWELENSPVPLKDQIPSFHAPVALCVSHGAVVTGAGLCGCVAVPGACHCPVTSQHLCWDWQGWGHCMAECLTITGRLEGTQRSFRSPRCAQATSAEQVHSWQPQGGRKGSPPFPHIFLSSHHVPIVHPSNPSTSSPILFSAAGNP